MTLQIGCQLEKIIIKIRVYRIKNRDLQTKSRTNIEKYRDDKLIGTKILKKLYTLCQLLRLIETKIKIINEVQTKRLD